MYEKSSNGKPACNAINVESTRNEIRKRLSAFIKGQQGKTKERSQAQTFGLSFYECLGFRAESATIYEQSIKKAQRNSGGEGNISHVVILKPTMMGISI